MPSTDYSQRYLRFNTLQAKNISLIVDIEGVDLLSNRPIFKRLRYGEPGVEYGDPGIVYGGLIEIPGVRDILSLQGASLTVGQKIEPEQGRGAISTLSLSFVDKDQYMTQVVSPGVIVPEILGRQVKVYIGYEQIAYPEEYTLIFRGRVSMTSAQSGRITIQLSDPNIARKQQIFYAATTTLSAGISDVDTTIPVVSNSDFHEQILGPDGTYDGAVKTYIRIGDEIIEYPATGFGVNEFTSVTRGARGTTAEAHLISDDVESLIEIEDHAIDMALKLMLSGYEGAYKSSVDIEHLRFTGLVDPAQIENGIILPFGVDADRDHGIAEGDYITITGDPTPSNNKTVIVTGFQDLFDEPNRVILTDDTFVSSSVTPAVMSIRSQYDVYPTTFGVKLTGEDVDIKRHVDLKNGFLSQSENSMRFFLDAPESCKDFIEKELWLPLGCYSLTRFGRISMNITKPPFADLRLSFLNSDNIKEPQTIKPVRALNNRKYFNEIQWTLDYDDEGDSRREIKRLDTESLSLTGISKVLPIKGRGIRTDLGFDAVIDRRTSPLLQRYRQCATLMTVKVNWEAGSLIEAGDIVVVEDNKTLFITNYRSGERDLTTEMFEVIDRKLNFAKGDVSLTLLGGIEGDITDRFATISPSSLVGVSSTTTRIRIKESFGEIFPGREQDKWIDYVGLPIIVHSYDWTFEEEVTFTGFDPGDPKVMVVSPALSAPPPEGYIVDIARYPTDTDTLTNKLYKLVHAHIDPSVTVVTGIDGFSFTVAPGDIAKFNVGLPVLIHNTAYSILSPESLITDVDGGTFTVTVGTDLTFTPAAGQLVELIGFADLGGPYRII
jgi:hypothetical protein